MILTEPILIMATEFMVRESTVDGNTGTMEGTMDITETIKARIKDLQNKITDREMRPVKRFWATNQ